MCSVACSSPTKVFWYRVSTKGNLLCNYVFENKMQVDKWVKEEFPKLKRKFGTLEYTISDLPGLQIGDKCHVWGEAQDVFKIERMVKFEEHRYGFVLDSGFVEEVAKCHTKIRE